MASPVVATPVPPGAVPSSVTTNSSDSSHTDGATSSNNNARSDTPPAEQHYSLKWNDYSLKLVTAFQNLRDEEDFVDVTVACDGHQYSAHKMVLSACSPYFRSMLKANPCQHPIVILKDVGHLELERLLEFMYNGEVNIAQDQLAAFLRTAENLKIRGLAGSSDDMEQMCNTSISNDKKDNSLKDDDDSDVLNEGYSSATKKRKLMSLDEQGNNKSNMKHEPCEGSENLCDVYGNDAQEQMMAAELYTAGVRGGGDDGNSSADTSGQHNEEGGLPPVADPQYTSLLHFNDISSQELFSCPSSSSYLEDSQVMVKTEPIDAQPTLLSSDMDELFNSFKGESREQSAEAVPQFEAPNQGSASVSEHPATCMCNSCRSCSYCNKTFSTLGSKKRHERDKHTDTQGVTCNLCGRWYKNKGSMIKHKSIRHRKNPPLERQLYAYPLHATQDPFMVHDRAAALNSIYNSTNAEVMLAPL